MKTRPRHWRNNPPTANTTLIWATILVPIVFGWISAGLYVCGFVAINKYYTSLELTTDQFPSSFYDILINGGKIIYLCLFNFFNLKIDFLDFFIPFLLSVISLLIPFLFWKYRKFPFWLIGLLPLFLLVHFVSAMSLFYTLGASVADNIIRKNVNYVNNLEYESEEVILAAPLSFANRICVHMKDGQTITGLEVGTSKNIIALLVLSKINREIFRIPLSEIHLITSCPQQK